MDELSNIVVSLAAVRYLLDHVQPENGDAENQEQQPGGNQEDQQVNPGAQASTALAVQQATQAILGSAGGAGQVEQIAQMLLANAAQ